MLSIVLGLAGSTTSFFILIWAYFFSNAKTSSGRRPSSSELKAHRGDIQLPSTYSYGTVRKYPKARVRDWVVEIVCFIGYFFKSRSLNGWRAYKTWLYGENYIFNFMVPGIHLKPRVVVSPLRAHGRALDLNYLADWKSTSETIDVINCASFDYSGFGELEEGAAPGLLECLQTVPHMEERGTEIITREAAIAGASFLGSKYCHFTSSGYTLNLVGLPAMTNVALAAHPGKRVIILQDASNHNSMYVGGFVSKGAKSIRFKHNSVSQLEDKLREYSDGNTHIIVAIEGNYSMEGGLPPLPAMLELKRQFGFQLYVDEAHSFFSIGHSGRGVIEHYNDLGYNLSWQDVDCYAITLSKSAGNIGGMLVCNDRAIYDAIKARDVEMQATGGDGCLPTVVKLRMMQIWGKNLLLSRRMAILRQHTVFILENLHRAGLVVHSDYLSPIIVVITISATNCALFGTECTRLGLACTWAGPPATEAWRSVGRLCINALLSREDVENVVRIVVKAAVNIGVASQDCLKRIENLRYDFEVDKSDQAALEAENDVVNREVHKVLKLQQEQNARDGLTGASLLRIPQQVLAEGAQVVAQQGIGSSSARLFWGTQVAHVKLEDRLGSMIPALKHICQDPHGMMLTDARNATVSTLSAIMTPPKNKRACNIVLLPRPRDKASGRALEEATMSNKASPRVVILHYDESLGISSTDLELMTSVARKAPSVFVTTYVRACDPATGKHADLDDLFKSLKAFPSRAGIPSSKVSGFQVMFDESRTFGTYGKRKLGLLDHLATASTEDFLARHVASLGGKDKVRFIYVGSLHHAFGLQGGFVVTDKLFTKILQWTCRAFIFTTAPMPFNVHMAHLCIDRLCGERTAEEGYTVLGDGGRVIREVAESEKMLSAKRRDSAVLARAGADDVRQMIARAELRKKQLEAIPASTANSSDTEDGDTTERDYLSEKNNNLLLNRKPSTANANHKPGRRMSVADMVDLLGLEP
ncbi:hypothetical protein PYCC9005_002584 [Savitreella phatthalungensis]